MTKLRNTAAVRLALAETVSLGIEPEMVARNACQIAGTVERAASYLTIIARDMMAQSMESAREARPQEAYDLRRASEVHAAAARHVMDVHGLGHD